MPVPKRKVSNSRRKQRRSHHGLKNKSLSVCPNCDGVKEPHCVCTQCGYYKGIEIIDTAKE
ncbi:MAG: 50S ribosomal protein L32 [Deltaproteobacteria bacterium]|nr:50S ribosomal protein L32 [Deltaproteobacteria bacterium]